MVLKKIIKIGAKKILKKRNDKLPSPKDRFYFDKNATPIDSIAGAKEWKYTKTPEKIALRQPLTQQKMFTGIKNQKALSLQPRFIAKNTKWEKHKDALRNRKLIRVRGDLDTMTGLVPWQEKGSISAIRVTAVKDPQNWTKGRRKRAGVGVEVFRSQQFTPNKSIEKRTAYSAVFPLPTRREAIAGGLVGSVAGGVGAGTTGRGKSKSKLKSEQKKAVAKKQQAKDRAANEAQRSDFWGITNYNPRGG